MTRVLVTGAGGFIGWHLVRRLRAEGCWVRGVDIKPPEFGPSAAHEFHLLDLRDPCLCDFATDGIDHIYAFAADMGGAGYVFSRLNDADIMSNNTILNANILRAALENNVRKALFSSSACVYPQHLQMGKVAPKLKEEDAYPSNPDSEYGREKLFAEGMFLAFARLTGLSTRIARFHNIYGTHGAWRGGREKVLAALCRKVAEAKLAGQSIGVLDSHSHHRELYQIEVWGDGEQIRSFLYVDDCVEGVIALMESGYTDAVNLGSQEAVTINELAHMIARAAGIEVALKHIPGPQGVRARNADTSLAWKELEWSPKVSLADGVARTYEWIEAQVRGGM